MLPLLLILRCHCYMLLLCYMLLFTLYYALPCYCFCHMPPFMPLPLFSAATPAALPCCHADATAMLLLPGAMLICCRIADMRMPLPFCCCYALLLPHAICYYLRRFTEKTAQNISLYVCRLEQPHTYHTHSHDVTMAPCYRWRCFRYGCHFID